jgi:hypothetical protein
LDLVRSKKGINRAHAQFAPLISRRRQIEPESKQTSDRQNGNLPIIRQDQSSNLHGTLFRSFHPEFALLRPTSTVGGID